MRPNKGFILISVFFIIIAMMSILGSVCLSISYQQKFAGRYISSIKAYHLALSGVQYARQHNYDDSVFLITPAPPVGKCDISLDPNGEKISIERVQESADTLNSVITGKATVNGVTETIKCASGDRELPLYMLQGIYGVTTAVYKDNKQRNLTETQVPIFGWTSKKEL